MRWRRLVRARLAEMERLAPTRGAVGARFWDARARRYAAATAGTARDDPLLAAVTRRVGRATTVLDVGAGPGRLTVPLAARALAVTAVDPSPVMLSLLRAEARRAGVGNVRCLVGRWEDVDPGAADVVLCSYVLPVVADADRFLARLDAAARRGVFVSLNAVSNDLVYDPLWRHFHGSPRRPAPTYLDALDVLAEMGIAADARVHEVPSRVRWRDLSEAAASVGDMLLLDGTPARRRELRALLGGWLVGPAGALRPPGLTRSVAVLSWAPTGASRRS